MGAANLTLRWKRAAVSADAAVKDGEHAGRSMEYMRGYADCLKQCARELELDMLQQARSGE